MVSSVPKDKDREGKEERRKTSIAPGPTLPIGPEAEVFKFAFLDFERVGASYNMATALHATYVADVDKILKRLEVKEKKKKGQNFKSYSFQERDGAEAGSAKGNLDHGRGAFSVKKEGARVRFFLKIFFFPLFLVHKARRSGPVAL